MDIFRGEDEKYQIEVKDTDGNILNLNTVSGIIAKILDRYGDCLVKYSRDTLAGFQDLTVTDATNGLFTFKFQSADNLLATLGTVDLEVKLQFTNTEYTSNTQMAVFIIKDFGEIKEARTDTTTSF